MSTAHTDLGQERVVDLNCDLGEGFGRWSLGDDEHLLEVVTSANVACGFHAGDPTTMRRVTATATANGVVVGAHVSYRDLAGFGRRAMDVPAGELADEVLYQIGALDAFCRRSGDRVRYVKPHGALYNRTVADEDQAGAVVAAVSAWGGLPVLGLPGSALLRAAERAGLPTVAEAFADRAYTPAGTLVSRSVPGAVVADPDAVVARAVGMVVSRTVTALDGSTVGVDARSLCLHGDTAGALESARRLRGALVTAGVRVAAFV